MPGTVRFHRVLKAPPGGSTAPSPPGSHGQMATAHGFTCPSTMEPKVGGTFKMSFTNLTRQTHSLRRGVFGTDAQRTPVRYTDRFDDPTFRDHAGHGVIQSRFRWDGAPHCSDEPRRDPGGNVLSGLAGVAGPAHPARRKPEIKTNKPGAARDPRQSPRPSRRPPLKRSTADKNRSDQNRPRNRGLGLKESKDAVDQYLKTRRTWNKKKNSPSSRPKP